MATNSKINRIKRSDLKFEKEIGVGAFSNVYQMRWKQGFLRGSIGVAAKKLHKRDIHELEVLSELDHAHVVKLLGVVDEKMEFMLILELCEGGSLRSYLDKLNGERLSDEQFFDWAEQVASPLEYLNQKHLVHKDVKSPNYMITAGNIVKLGDFGIAKNLVATIDNATETASYQWMAPELLVKGILSPKYDIFALAVVLWELWTGKFPWKGCESQVVAWKVCNDNERLPIPENCPELIKDLIRECWETEWKRRPDIDSVMLVITTSAAMEAKQRQIIAGTWESWEMAREFGDQDGLATSPIPTPALAASATMEARQRKIIAGSWEMVRKFGHHWDGFDKLSNAQGIALSPDGSVVVADWDASRIRIYSLSGECKSSIDTTYGLKPGKGSYPWKVIVNSDNVCFLSDCCKQIRMYEISGKYKGEWVSSNWSQAYSRSRRLEGLAMNHAGDLLVSDCENLSINRHRQDGTHLGRIKVGIEAKYIAVTSQDTIVIADWGTPPQIVSNTGQVIHTLKHPVDESGWNPQGVYCHEDIIFVANLRTENILCYTESGKYLGPIPIPPVYACGGIAMTSDCKTLLVCEYETVKVFTSSMQQ